MIRNSEGQPAAGAQVQVWAAGEDAAKVVATDDKGGFQLGGLAPGDYRIVAWEAIDDDLLHDPPFRARFESQVTAVTLSERARQNVEVKLIGRAAIEAEAAKVR